MTEINREMLPDRASIAVRLQPGQLQRLHWRVEVVEHHLEQRRMAGNAIGCNSSTSFSKGSVWLANASGLSGAPASTNR